MDSPLRLIASNPVDHLARTIEALLVVASAPLSAEELAEAADDDPERVLTALGLLRERYSEKRSGIVLEEVAGGFAFRASREASEACARLFERPVERGLSQAALETLAVVAYLGPVLASRGRPYPRRRGRLGGREPRRARADRGGGARVRPRRRGPLPDDAALRARVRAREPRRAPAARRPRRGRGRAPRAPARGRVGARLVRRDSPGPAGARLGFARILERIPTLRTVRSGRRLRAAPEPRRRRA